MKLFGLFCATKPSLSTETFLIAISMAIHPNRIIIAIEPALLVQKDQNGSVTIKRIFFRLLFHSLTRSKSIYGVLSFEILPTRMLIDKKTKEVLRGVSLGLLLVSSVAVQSRREARELLRCFAKQKKQTERPTNDSLC